MKASQVRIVIQSRMTSSRLPGKAMLCIRGYPSVVLCALRAANSGLSVVVATSEHAEDDVIAREVEAAGIRVHRGSLHDVLGRYVSATADMAEDDFVVRFTADNMFPDGRLVSELIAQAGPEDSDLVAFGAGFPYGMGAEAVRVKWLRTAHENAASPYDREHVMPWVARHCAPRVLPWPGQESFGDCTRLRCTMDSLSDYLCVRRAFDAAGGDPIQVSWRELVASLRDAPDAPQQMNPRRLVHGVSTGTLQLGAAQLGMPYGIANPNGQLSEDHVAEIFHEAMIHGVDVIDTAREYGAAETRIGKLIEAGNANRFRTVTKLSGLHHLPPDAGDNEVRQAVDASVLRSCRELRVQKLPVLMLHCSHHLDAWQGAIWQRLLELQSEGLIHELGLSIYRPEELTQALAHPQVRHLQLPFNLLDRRWLEASAQEQLKGIIEQNQAWITARSVVLQGLLRLPAERWPSFPDINSDQLVATLERLVKAFRRISIVDLCLAYVRAQSWVHSIVIGVDSSEQLLQNVAFVNQPPLSPDECHQLEAQIPAGPDHLVNPALWHQGAPVAPLDGRASA